MRLGFGTDSLPDTPLEEVIRWAGVNGFCCLEVAAHLTRAIIDDSEDQGPAYPPGERLPKAGVLEIASMTDDRVSNLKRLMAETGVTFSSIAYYPNLLHPTLAPAARECALQVIDVAAKLGCNWTTHVGRDPHLDVSDDLDLFEKVWPDVIEYAAGKSVTIAVDNCPQLETEFEWPGGLNIAISPVVWRRIFEICPQKNFGLHLDTWNFVYQRIEPDYAINSLGNRIISVRATDGHWNQTAANELGTLAVFPHLLVQHCVIGTGDLDIAKVFGALRCVGFNGDVIIEHKERADLVSGTENAGKALQLGKRLVERYLV